MKKKQRVISGYQVRPADLDSIRFELHDLETCKRYCRQGEVIVSTYHKKFAFRINLTFGKRYWWWHYSRYDKSLDIAWLNIRWEWIYLNEPLKIVWRNKQL